ncbi:hypothetical protein GF351_02930 [Candidatus Woesearchaeota archaeon]|nr:hypothetical protein [Candidatus Woesearchaeota archaeon]
MVIVGFNITKIEASRKGGIKGQVKINNNVSIEKVEPQKLNLGKAEQQGIRFDFTYSTDYEPGIGSVVMKGHTVTIEEETRLKEILDGWKKDKKLPNEVMNPILNSVLQRCTIKAIALSQDINLPPPVPMPKVQAQESKKK